jgi:hypothetical protein
MSPYTCQQYNIAYEGVYEPQPEQPSNSSTRITLKPFADSPCGSCSSSSDAAASPDGQVAMRTLPPLMRTLDVMGERPWRWAQCLLRLLVGLPYDPDNTQQIAAYVRKYADQHLLTEQVCGPQGGLMSSS